MKAAWLFLVIGLLAGCQYPDITLRGEPRPSIPPAQVQLVYQQPEGASHMGQAYAWSAVPVDTAVGYRTAVTRLQERASSIGANILYVPAIETIHLPSVQQRWMDPVQAKRSEDDEDIRPQELMGQLYYRP